MKKQAFLKIRGNVQGVFFRAYTKDRAQELGLSGWVRNMPDGNVEVCAQGDQDSIKELISWCYEGSPAASVDEVEVKWEPLKEDFKTFEIRY